MTTKKQTTQHTKKLKEDSDNEIDFKKITRVDTIGFYLLLICGLIILIGGIDMTFSNSSSVGWSPGGRFNAGRQGSITGPTAIVFGLILLFFPLYKQIKKTITRKRSKASSL